MKNILKIAIDVATKLLLKIHSRIDNEIPSLHEGTQTDEPIKGLKEEDFVHNVLTDEEGYHCDSETKDFKYNGNGCYSLTVKNLGRSDKTVNNELKAGDFISVKIQDGKGTKINKLQP